jgi:hypothetical protein
MEVEVSNGFELISPMLFAKYSAVSHIYNVDKFQAAKLLKLGCDVYFSSIKSDGEEWNAYLVDLGYKYGRIGSELLIAVNDIIDKHTIPDKV